MNKKYYVYKITNTVNNKIYIGKCYSLNTRWNAHKTCSKKLHDKKRSQYLHNSIAKYGQDKFTIEEIAMFENEKDCLDSEMFYIAYYNSMDRNIGYNLTHGGDGVSGYIYSDEQKRKMSEHRKGKYLGRDNSFFGKKHTDETKKIMSDKALERDYSKEKNPFYGKKHSSQTIDKIKNHQNQNKKLFSHKELEIIRSKHKFNIENNLKIKYSLLKLSEEYNVSVGLLSRIVRKYGLYKEN